MAMGVAETKLLRDALGGPAPGVGGGSTPRQPAPGGKKVGNPLPLAKRLTPEQLKRFML